MTFAVLTIPSSYNCCVRKFYLSASTDVRHRVINAAQHDIPANMKFEPSGSVGDFEVTCNQLPTPYSSTPSSQLDGKSSGYELHSVVPIIDEGDEDDVGTHYEKYFFQAQK
mmetsp:Transcript_29303/g.32914  ORF Transcript_29303/g.32914 Transcript_29303/m.32914 type:complete len:111 (+) Transcript_29303:122-454(+)